MKAKAIEDYDFDDFKIIKGKIYEVREDNSIFHSTNFCAVCVDNIWRRGIFKSRFKVIDKKINK